MNYKPLSFLFSFYWGIVIPVILWLVFTPWSGWLDLELSKTFFENGTFPSHPLWDWLYVYGLWPAWVMIVLAVAGFACSFADRCRHWRKPCLLLILTLAIGSQLVIHGVFKDHWGRPRPKQVSEFGGHQPFRPYYQPNFSSQPEPSKSFTCGHCSMGFTFFSLALLGAYTQSRFFQWLGWILAWSLGLLLSAARIAQGGHFLSDTLASALIMWITAWILAYLLLIRNGRKDERLNS